jgi:phosphoribosylamine-glycine ligase
VQVDLAVVGPEQPLAEGLTDALLAAGIACYGPSQAAAQLESSKAFAKDFMARHGIPTARYAVFHDAAAATHHIESAPYQALVVKASGLAAGKGVIVADNKSVAQQAVKDILAGQFGDAGKEASGLAQSGDGSEASVAHWPHRATASPRLAYAPPRVG